MSRRRVAVTGLGIVCPVGNNVEEAWQNLIAGKPGIGAITRFDASPFACRIAGEVRGFDVAAYLPAKEARHMDLFIHYGLAASVQAVQDSGLPTGDALTEERAERIGCVVGSGIGGLPLIEETHTELAARGPSLIEQTPLKRLGQPEEVAHTVAYLCSDWASFITGETIHVNGGLYIAS